MMNPGKFFGAVMRVLMGSVGPGPGYRQPLRNRVEPKQSSNRKAALLEKALRRQARSPRC